MGEEEEKGSKKDPRKRLKEKGGKPRIPVGWISPLCWTSILRTQTMKTIKSVPRKKRVRGRVVMRNGHKPFSLRGGRNQTNLVMSDLEIPLLELVLSLDQICVLFCNRTCH